MSTAELDEPAVKYEPHWVTRAAFPLVTAAFLGTQVLVGLCVAHHLYWLAAPLAFLVSHFMHGQLIGFHEASHGLLRKTRKLNEIDGVLIGIFSFTSFSLYRAAHQSHHIHLSTERDEEFWPFTDPRVPRWQRVLTAVLELNFGLFITPLIFARTFLRRNSPIRNQRVRRRIWAEWALTAIVWSAVVAAVAHFQVWEYFLWIYFIPAFLAGNLQSWRKYIEHVGLMSETINGATRTVVAQSWLSKFVSVTLLHEPYHGVHHMHGGVPFTHTPGLTASLTPKNPGERPPFRSYTQAWVDLLRSLANPRVGAQWRS